MEQNLGVVELRFNEVTRELTGEKINWFATVEPRFNDVPRDSENQFVLSRVRYIEVLFPYILL